MPSSDFCDRNFPENSAPAILSRNLGILHHGVLPGQRRHPKLTPRPARRMRPTPLLQLNGPTRKSLTSRQQQDSGTRWQQCPRSAPWNIRRRQKLSPDVSSVIGLRRRMVRVVGIEPTLLSEPDFESGASTSFTTPAHLPPIRAGALRILPAEHASPIERGGMGCQRERPVARPITTATSFSQKILF